MPAPIWGDRLVMVPRMTPAAPARPEPREHDGIEPLHVDPEDGRHRLVLRRRADGQAQRGPLDDEPDGRGEHGGGGQGEEPVGRERDPPERHGPAEQGAGSSSETMSAPQMTLADPSKNSDSPNVRSKSKRCERGSRSRSGRKSHRSITAPR